MMAERQALLEAANKAAAEVQAKASDATTKLDEATEKQEELDKKLELYRQSYKS
jgi:hypothetical protein